jgi:CheY-like chemotaxis protein
MQPDLVLLFGASDDDRELYGQGLRSVGFAVACVSAQMDLAAATRLLEPSVVVLALDPPEQMGWNACAGLYVELGNKIPVLVLTAAVRPDGSNRALARLMPNCAAFVGKPCDHIALAGVLRRVLAGERDIEITSMSNERTDSRPTNTKY